jgi:hypothetical protein
VTQQRKQLSPTVTSLCWIKGIPVLADVNSPWPDFGEWEAISNTIKTHLAPLTEPGDLVWLAAGPREETVSMQY